MISGIIATFTEGLLSFFSPCVLPLLPLYMAYMSNEKDGENYSQKKTFIRTLFFVLGVFTVLVFLALSASAINKYLTKYKNYISLVGALIIFIFGLQETGIININFLNKEAKLNVDLKLNKMNIFKAYLFGFVFAFGWTPCIGPMLTSAVILAATREFGYLYIFSYGLGLTLPFLITGIFTSFVLNLLNKHKKIMNYVLKIAGVFLIVFALYTMFNSVSTISKENELNNRKENRSSDKVYVPDTIFKDAYGNEYDLNDYYGKFVYLNLTATWCGYCKQELPYYEDFCNNHDDVACFLVMNHQYNYGSDTDDIKEYIKKNDVTLPILLDDNQEIFGWGLNGVPFLWIINPESEVFVYQPGSLAYTIDGEVHNGFEDLHSSVEEFYNEMLE